ncbi:rhodanese-like domain-containing protein [Desulfobacula sp.]|uniref:rhodanese-like domain-containing protein n=1 Tax=Desulfobacula sp. TaxID=2593537 RepID=UPI0025BFEEA5|nr:rhodanese-like domain-containing protein [Desulfobacula sp.]MBC2704764.1 rhodanese-like domain-containing protein [Desulfobacula sp.]
MQRTVFQLHLNDVARQAFSILFMSVAIGLAVNMVRPDSIPVIADWSTENRLTSESGETLIIPTSLAKALFEKNEAVFMDARDKDQFDMGHIKGAKNLPWHAVDDYFMDIVQDLPNDTTIITYCDGESCDLSHELSLFLMKMGFNHVKVLVNGWTVWQELNLPVEGDSFED